MALLSKWKARMTAFMAIAGLIIGALAAWLLSKAYSAFIPRESGDLAIPFLLVAGAGLLAAKKQEMSQGLRGM